MGTSRWQFALLQAFKESGMVSASSGLHANHVSSSFFSTPPGCAAQHSHGLVWWSSGEKEKLQASKWR
jgi:hypothetical protein